MTAINMIMMANSRVPKLLDIYPNASLCLSTRKLRNNYNGPALRIRRSNDNLEKDITFNSSGFINESSITSFVGSNSAFVSIWYDQSGNNRNATQTSLTNQPRIVNNGILDRRNGFIGPWFNKSSFYFDLLTPVPVTQTYFGFCTGYSAPPSGEDTYIAGSAGAVQFRLTATGGGNYFPQIVNASVANILDGSGVSGNRVNLNTYVTLPGDNRVYVNSILRGSNSSNAGYSQPISSVGYNRSVGSEYYSDVMHEVIIYSNDISGIRDKIESNILKFYSIL